MSIWFFINGKTLTIVFVFGEDEKALGKLRHAKLISIHTRNCYLKGYSHCKTFSFVISEQEVNLICFEDCANVLLSHIVYNLTKWLDSSG